jgi:hypothetical protein
MNNFVFHNPTKIIFGKETLGTLSNEISAYTDSVLLLYGKGSIRKIGLYDKVTELLKKANIRYAELNGVDPNPRISTVREGIKICREKEIGLILAVGGGSVLDCGKAIAIGTKYEGDPWDFFAYTAEPKEALPLGTILTLSATGSEMNQNAVITNMETLQKHGYGHDLMRPKFSFLDPTLTYSVSKWHTAAGSADIFCHLVEHYFDRTDSAWIQNRLIEAVMKTVVHYTDAALKTPDDYEARANLMWAGTMALNGAVSEGKVFDGFNHTVEHAFSAVYDITHGAGLSILMTHWLEEILSPSTEKKLAEFARNVWNIEEADDRKASEKGILEFRRWLKAIGMPTQLSEVDVPSDRFNEILEKSFLGPGKKVGMFSPLDSEGTRKVLNRAI